MLLRRFQVFFLTLLGVTLSYHFVKHMDTVVYCGRTLYRYVYVPSPVGHPNSSLLVRPPPILTPYDTVKDPTVMYAFHPMEHDTHRRIRR